MSELITGRFSTRRYISSGRNRWIEEITYKFDTITLQETNLEVFLQTFTWSFCHRFVFVIFRHYEALCCVGEKNDRHTLLSYIGFNEGTKHGRFIGPTIKSSKLPFPFSSYTRPNIVILMYSRLGLG